MRKNYAQSNAQRGVGSRFTYDAERLVIVSDQTGEDDIEVHWEDNRRMPKRLNIPPRILGRVEEMVLSPEAPLACVVNHRAELLVIDINTGENKLADKSLEDRGLYQCSWSPCGNWIAYTFRRRDTEVIKILDVRTGRRKMSPNQFWEIHLRRGIQMDDICSFSARESFSHSTIHFCKA